MALLAVVVTFVRRQRLSVSTGLVWCLLLIAALLVLGVPGLMEVLTSITGAKYPVSAMTLITFSILFLYVFYLSVHIQRLERKHCELVRSIGFLDRRLRDKPMRSAAEPEATSDVSLGDTPAPPAGQSNAAGRDARCAVEGRP
jgi:hypothetical protein